MRETECVRRNAIVRHYEDQGTELQWRLWV